MDTELDFLNFISKLKHLDRTGWVQMGVKKPESVAGHMYRMAVMSAFIIDDPSLDASKCIKLSLVHDMGESIIGDITPHDGVDVLTKQKLEVDAVSKISGLISKNKGEEIQRLFEEYENGETPEAKLVKDLDRFDMVLQAYEYERSENKPKFLQQFFDSTREHFKNSHPKIKELVSKLNDAREHGIPFSQ